MCRLGLLFPILVSIVPTVLLSGCGFGEHSEILLLVREGAPESRTIALAYADARDIPTDRILELSLSGPIGAIEIDPENYLREIAQPIEDYLEQNDSGGEISSLITTRGFPLRIGHCSSKDPHYPRDCHSAALDAALAQLGRTGRPTRAFQRVENPFFRDSRSFESFREDHPESPLRFLVARLSAAASPDQDRIEGPEIIRSVLTRLSADATDTPMWRVVSEDPRATRTVAAASLLDPIADRLPAYGIRVCDGCEGSGSKEDPQATSKTAPQAAGVVLQFKARRAEPPRPTHSLTYPGFVIGLDAASIERGSDATATSPFDRFITDWFLHGAGAISTHIGDPSLSDVVRPTDQLIALARGRTAIEAHFASVPQLGWTNVFVGDPLLALSEEGLTDLDRRDQDLDGVEDREDNCRNDPNPDQRDTNADGLGNLCDPDVDNDGSVETSWGAIYPVDQRGDLETISLTARNGPHDDDHDLDGDGRVDERDLVRTQLWVGRMPGQYRPVEQAE